MNTNSQQERTLRASSPPTLFLYLILFAFCAIWMLGILAWTGHRLLSWNNITTLVGVAAWGLVWQGAYAIFRPHRPIVRKLYCASLAFWGVVILVYSIIQHHFKLDWLVQKTWPAPIIIAASGLLFVAIKMLTQDLDLKAEHSRRRILILGSGSRASIAWRELRTRHHSAARVLGFVDTRDPEHIAPDIAKRIVSTIEDLPAYLLDHVIDEIVIASPLRSCYDSIETVVHLAETTGVHVSYMRDLISPRSADRMDGSFSLFHSFLPLPQTHFWHVLLKRAIDVTVSSIVLFLSAPIFVLVAVLVRITSAGPVFFAQDRVGHNRREFTMLKFRSMVKDAPKLLAQLEGKNQASGPLFKLDNDPRITPLGRFMRKTSIDELPQLFNVLVGDMSLVGPRPLSQRDMQHVSDIEMLRRFAVKPGMTGMWQVNGRSSSSAHHWMAMDTLYIDRWSLRLDLQILAMTLPAVLKRSGAY